MFPVSSSLEGSTLQQAIKAKVAGSSPATRLDLLYALGYTQSSGSFNSSAVNVMRYRPNVFSYSGD